MLIDYITATSAVLLAAVSTAVGAVELMLRFSRRGTSRVDLTLDSREIDALAQTLGIELTAAANAGRPASETTPPQQPPTPAELEALAILKVYGKELLAEATRIARRTSAERPSKQHVRQAADRIGVMRDRAGVAADLALAVGSILIGAAVSYQVNIWTGGVGGDGIAIWMVMALAVGVGVCAAAAGVKWRRS